MTDIHTAKPKIGLVTVLYNSEDVLPDFFDSLAKQDYLSYWLYVIDNSPTNASALLAQKLATQHQIHNISIVRNADNLGVATGNNQGIRLALEAGCKYVLLLNNDIVFQDTALLSNIVTLADHDHEDMIVPKIYYHDSGLIWYAGGHFEYWRGFIRHQGQNKPANTHAMSDRYVEYAPTCFMLIRAEIFKKVGWMDEQYFVYFDDTDFVWRAKNAGVRIKYWAGGEVWHKVSSSTGGEASAFSIYYLTRNRIYFIRKQMRTVHQSVAIPYLLITQIIKALAYNQSKRTALWNGIKDGFTMAIMP